MNTEIWIHYHFKFSYWILHNTWYAKNITFQNIPFFQLYPLRNLYNIEIFINAVRKEMPPQYQKLFNWFNPPKHIKNNYYRQEHINLSYCEFNNQAFFLRCYQLRQHYFIKVEITFFAEAIWSWKYLHLENTIQSAEKIFTFLGQNTFPVPLSKHRDDYFFITDLKKYISVFKHDLLLLNSQDNTTIKKNLKKILKERLIEFENDSQYIAQQRLESIKEKMKINDILQKDLL